MAYTKVNHGFLVEGKILGNFQNAPLDISNMIESVTVREAYLENVFPIFMVGFQTTEEYRDIMRDNDISLYLRISYYNIDDLVSVEEEDSQDINEIGVVFEGNIRVYSKPFSTTAAKKEEETDEARTQSESAPFVYYQLTGIPEELISKNETVVNLAFKNCELADALVYTISSIDKTSDMFIQETYNKEIFESIVIPPLSLTEAIEFLDDNYENFYECDANLYYGTNGLYLYDIMSFNPELKTNVYECSILSTDATGDFEKVGLAEVDEENNIRSTYRTIPPYTDLTKIQIHTLGSHTVFYYYDNNYNLVSRNMDNPESFTKTKYIWNKMNQEGNEIFKLSKGFVLPVKSLNPALINPLTILRINSSQYKEIAGDYRISQMDWMLTSSDKKHFSGMLNLTTVGYKNY